MPARTDLAIDINETLSGGTEGIAESREQRGDIRITRIKIISDEGSEKLGKPQGNYITAEFPPLFEIEDFRGLKTVVKDMLLSLLPEKAESVMVVGLGNTEITSDAIGPFTAKGILATRHIAGQFAKSIGLEKLRSIAVISPGVLGKTGIETTEIISAAVKTVKPDAVIAVDALCSRSVTRLYKTVQLCDSGISPGSGVKNSRRELSQKTLGVPVIALGVPTVVEADTLAYELTGSEVQSSTDLLVTPKEADLLTDRISGILSAALNLALQPDIDPDIILGLV